MGRGEISWKRRSPQGERYQVYAQRKGDHWEFFIRQRRFENWKPLARPLVEDWLELLEGVRRRVARRLIRPEEVARLLRKIQAEFPGTVIHPEEDRAQDQE